MKENMPRRFALYGEYTDQYEIEPILAIFRPKPQKKI